jgi:hypothetical protein
VIITQWQTRQTAHPPHPSRRKLFPQASEAAKTPPPQQIHPAERDRAAASLGGDHQNPSRKARKPHPPPSLLSERRPDPAERPIHPAERDRAAASIGTSTPCSPSRASAKAQPVPTFPASAGPIPRSAPYAKRSGIGPQRALEAINKIPSAQRESPSSPELPQRAQARSRGAPHTPSGAGSGRSKPWRRSPKPLAQSAKAQSSPEPPQRAQARSRGAPPTTQPAHPTKTTGR